MDDAHQLVTPLGCERKAPRVRKVRIGSKKQSTIGTHMLAAMKTLSALFHVIVVAWLSACAPVSAPIQEPDSDTKAGPRVVVGPQAARTVKLEKAWVSYGARRRQAIIERSPTSHNQSLDDYPIEFVARLELAKRWRDRENPGQESDPYLDTLVRVEEAGYLEEYVFLYFGKPGWTLAAEVLPELDFEGFYSFGREHLVGHEPETLVAVEDTGVPSLPSVPGGNLPDFFANAPTRSPCDQLGEARAALERWRSEERRLDGVALAAGRSQELVAALALMRDSPEVQGRGVTWVSFKAASLNFLVGFCEIDRRDHAAALVPLAAATRLYPLAPMWHLELAGALIQTKQFDDADRAITVAMTATDDACTLGVAWRRKGYLLVDRGALQEALQAYAKSLEYDPGNRLALHELALIERELRRTGGQVPSDYRPPPPGEQFVSQCKGG